MNENNHIIEKAKYYKSNEIKCHVVINPKGSFHNGLFVSELKEGKYFWFMRDDGIPFRLFLSEIYIIEDYKKREGEE